MKQNLFAVLALGMAVCLEVFPIRLAAATVTWIGGSGDWDTVTNWSTGLLPGTNDDVVIGAGASINVTHSTGTDTVRSVQSQQAFVLSGGTLTVSNTFQASNTFTLSGGTLQTATVMTTNGASLIAQSGTLDRVTLNGVLDVGNSVNGASVTVTNGLTSNGTDFVGNPTSSWYGQIDFVGRQSLSGNGTVVLGNYASGCGSVPRCNSLRLIDGGTTLTIGAGITVEGQNGTIGSQVCFGDPQNISVINQGVVSTSVAVGIIMINAQPFSNTGTLSAPIRTLSLSGTYNLVGGAINVGISHPRNRFAASAADRYKTGNLARLIICSLAQAYKKCHGL